MACVRGETAAAIYAARCGIPPTHDPIHGLQWHELCWAVLRRLLAPHGAPALALVPTAFCPTSAAEVAAHAVDQLSHGVRDLVRAPMAPNHAPDADARLLLLDQAWAAPNPHSLTHLLRQQLVLSGAHRFPRSYTANALAAADAPPG